MWSVHDYWTLSVLAILIPGRGQGTPFLRAGIHRIAENSDYEDSDEFTEWPGFNHANADEDDEENEGHAGRERTKDVPNASQGDKQDAPNDLEVA